jgi:hypothetical protein
VINIQLTLMPYFERSIGDSSPMDKCAFRKTLNEKKTKADQTEIIIFITKNLFRLVFN